LPAQRWRQDSRTIGRVETTERGEAVKVPTTRAWVCSACGQAASGTGPTASLSVLQEPQCRNLWCRAPDRPVEAVFAVGNYEGALKKAIVAYKYRWDLRWARPFGAMLYRFVNHNPTWFEEYGVICPVPQFVGPGARRPWEHVGLVCAEFGRLADGAWPVERLLSKEVETDVMSSKGGQARRQLARRTLRNAFSVTDPGAVVGRRVLLVDDVCASGYTLLSVARTLRQAGAEEVTALVLARARWRPGRRG
jgi:predicted amidophosphoribosyltransferase